MSNSKMIPSNVAEVLHLFEVMQKYKVNCSLELNTGLSADPFISIASAPVNVEYLECSGGPDAVIVTLGDMDMCFELGSYQFAKYVSSCQIMIAISDNNDTFTAWFNSEAVPSEGIEETRNNPYEIH